MAAKKRMHFRGGLGFPLPIAGGTLRFDPARLPDHYANNERGRGGWYPLGANQTWHNGIHLHAAGGGGTVHAVADGTIVAARLTEDWDEKLHPFGSNCFVLLRHELSLIDDPAQRRSWDTDTWSSVRDVTFYSLYMHLDPRIDKLDEVPWLASYRPFLRDGLRYEGQVWRVKKPARAPIPLHAEPKPVDGEIERRPAVTGSTRAGALVELLGDPVEAQLGAEHHVYRHVKVIEPGKARAQWADGWIRVDGDRIEQTDAERIIRDLQNGGVVHVGCTVEAGECVGHAGPIAAEGTGDAESGRGVHAEIFSAENLVTSPAANGWTVCEDTSADDVICEDRALLGQIQAADPDFFTRLKALWDRIFGQTLSVARREYESRLSAEDKAKLRRIITRNTSFWAIDWKAMAKRSENEGWCASFALPDDVLDAATRYSWWRELPGGAKGMLPKSSLLFHYHPLELLRYLSERVPRAPVFFLERKEGGKPVRYVVSKPDHLDPAVQDTVSVYEPRFPDEQPVEPDEWILEKRKNYPFAAGDRQVPKKGGGTEPGWAGLGYTGKPDLYTGLVGRADANPALASAVADCASAMLPDGDAAAKGALVRDLRNVWAAIWHSEGGLDAFNSYDNGHLSVGALQQIAGPVSAGGSFKTQGELGAAMHAVKTSGPEGARLFERYFGRYGLDTGSKNTPAGTAAATRTLAFDVAPPSPGGPAEVTTLADLARARWFVWSWCVVRALRDPLFIRLFYAYGFTRVRIIRALKETLGGEPVTLGKLLETQLAQALMLDWHINSPTNAIKGWTKGLNLAAKIDWAEFGAEQEYERIDAIVKGRRAPGAMTDGPRRSAYIVLCARGLAYPGKGQPFQRATWDAWASTHDAFLKKIGYPGGAAQLLWEANHEAKQPFPTPAPALANDDLKQWTAVLKHTYDFLEHARS
ncbi:MAG TPA: hypothetical protein VFL83_23020 [Anaeromyxobacter sp.]|nr:hypothetical protein [Anaeromyxobacter sp.]